LMIKPAMYYLDVISKVKQMTSLPVGAYQVSGEFSMIYAASQNNWLDLQKVAIESLYCLKRAGADFIISYFTKDLADWI
ncbi:MAG: porphobilinogen synthase, partial [Romboutsia sp.]|nr:porphobilinogen synthase [Romboutsia sp.]